MGGGGKRQLTGVVWWCCDGACGVVWWELQLGLSQLILVYHLNLSLGIPNEAFALGDSVVLTVLGQLAFMPTLVLAARLCPPGEREGRTRSCWRLTDHRPCDRLLIAPHSHGRATSL